jgi:hypothetical protein
MRARALLGSEAVLPAHPHSIQYKTFVSSTNENPVQYLTSYDPSQRTMIKTGMSATMNSNRRASGDAAFASRIRIRRPASASGRDLYTP